MTPARLIPLPDGPYEATGALVLADPDGAPIKEVCPCRSGRSANNPACDGSHTRTGSAAKDA